MDARRNPSRKLVINPVLGVGLLVLGVLFLFQQWFHPWLWWPLLIILPGVALLYAALHDHRSDHGRAPLAVPGVLVTGTGTILLYQSVTGNWASWAYVWTLYPTLLGAGLWLMGRLNGSVATMLTGRKFVLGGLAAFILLCLFFAGVGSWWPILLIVGGWLVWRTTRRS